MKNLLLLLVIGLSLYCHNATAALIDELRSKAEKGDVEAQCRLGGMYVTGKAVPKDFAEAAKWYRKAAEQGNVDAQNNLGCIYQGRTGVPKDLVEAVKWFQKAAGHGDDNAQFNLGGMYESGEGVPRDEIEALAWYNLAASTGEDIFVSQRNKLENKLGHSLVILAQQRSKRILAQIEKNKQAKSSESSLQNEKSNADMPKASGSAVFVSTDGLLITAAHVVRDAIRISVVTTVGLKKAQLIQIDTANDVAILKCDGVFTPAPVRPSKSMKLGQTVFTLGFPNIQLQGFSPKMTRGEISSLSGIQDDPRQWQISVPLQPGNSGGGLFDENGNLVGIVVAKLDAIKIAKVTGDIPENVNYAVKSSYILSMLENYSNSLPQENIKPSKSGKLEDVVEQTEKSVALILIY
ncbi:MAG: tetratricopeptide repeat-containing serine protease family protein [Methylacidiphilales bacterium]|nr:tetratricopeptide repeat-containing serine protease family protein [Candidatus Methylacidiphilales bacterium]